MSKQDQDRRVIRSARDRAEKHTSGFDSTSIKIPEGVKLFKLEKGTMFIDIIPYVVGRGNPFADKGEVHYERTFFVHRGVGPGGDSYICLKKTLNERCPVCEHRAKLAKDPDADEQLVKDMAPRERQLFNVINRKDRDAGIQLWDVSYHLFGKLLDARIQSDAADESWAMFHSPTEGLTLVLTVAEKTFGGNTFCEVTAIDFKERKEQYKESIIDKAICLDKVLKIEEYDKLKSILLQTEDDDSDSKRGSDDDDKPSKKRASDDDDDDKPSKRRSDDDDDDRPAKKASRDDDDDDDKPSRKSSDDDDDDKPSKKSSDDDDDDRPAKKSSRDDDDEKPTKKSRFIDDDDDDKPSKKSSDDDDDDKPAKKSSKDDDDDDRPAKKRSADDDDDDKPSKKSSKSDDDDDDKPAKKKGGDDDDDIPWDDDDKPAKKKSSKEDDDD